MALNVLEGSLVDLINPFPVHEIERFERWLYCFKTFSLPDNATEDKQAFRRELLTQLNSSVNWGVIDKLNTTSQHPAPLVGGIILTKAGEGAEINVCSTRTGLSRGLADEAVKLVLSKVFDEGLLRVGLSCLNTNSMAKKFAQRLGFKFEGCMKDFIKVGGEPRDMCLYGLTKREYFKLESV